MLLASTNCKPGDPTCEGLQGLLKNLKSVGEGAEMLLVLGTEDQLKSLETKLTEYLVTAVECEPKDEICKVSQLQLQNLRSENVEALRALGTQVQLKSIKEKLTETLFARARCAGLLGRNPSLAPPAALDGSNPILGQARN